MKQLIFFVILFAQQIYGWDLFDTLTQSHNTTTPSIHKSASAGYLSGGGASWRTHRNTLNPVNISLPSVQSGCDGIDFYGGSISMVNGEKLKQLGLNLMKQAPSFALHLALKTYSPQMEAVMSQLEDLTTMVNQANIDTCQILRSASAAYLPNGDLKKSACKEFQMSGKTNDFFSASEKCKTHEEVQNFESKLNKGKDRSIQQDFPTPKNILFAAALNSGMEEKEAEILMTLAGTIVINANPQGSAAQFASQDLHPIFYPSLVRADDFEKYIDGASTNKQYKCTDQSGDQKVKCLILKEVEIKNSDLLSLDGIRNKTREAINRTIDGLADNAKFSKESVQFLESQYSVAPIFDWLLVVSKGILPKEALGELFPEYIFLNYLKKTLNEALTILHKEMPRNLSVKPHFMVLEKNIKALQKIINFKAVEMEKKLKITAQEFEKAYRKLTNEEV